MLPSTGYFKGINCPFYDSGLCERPYCHFRHVRKEQQGLSNEGIENGAIFHQLVSEAVKKVLQHKDVSNSPQPVQFIDADVSAGDDSIATKPAPKVTYNPTPISELEKLINAEAEKDENSEQRRRHIPVPYTPRKPASLPRPVGTNGDTQPFIYIPPPVQYLPGTNDGALPDPYMPMGGTESKEKYVPGKETELQEYKPVESKSTNKLSYVPSDKSVPKKRILEYRPKPTKVSSKADVPTVTYQPTPLSQVPCFSSDEDEPDNKKKRKLSSDLNSLDELGAEFDIIGQILDEEKSKDETKNNTDDTIENKESKHGNIDPNKEKNQKSDKPKVHQLYDSKERDLKGRDNHDKAKSSDRKSSHKYTKDKDTSHKSSSKDSDTSHKNSSKVSDTNHKTSSKDSDARHKSFSKEIDSTHKSSSKDRDSTHKGSSKDRDSTHKSSSKDKDSTHKDSNKNRDSTHKSSSNDRDSTHKSSSKERDHRMSNKDREHIHKNSNIDRGRSKDKKKNKEKESSHKKSLSSSKLSVDTKYKSSNSSKSVEKISSKHSHNSKSKSHDKKDKYSKLESSHRKSKEKRSKDNKDKRKEELEEANISDYDEIANDTNVNEDIESISESDEEAIALECKKIFEEYVPTEKPRNIEESPQEAISDEYIPTKKRISRTIDKSIKIIPKEPIKPDFKKSAAQKMAERLTKIREFHAARNLVASVNAVTTSQSIQTPIIPSTITVPPTTGPSKVRIAHVPYASFMMNAKKTIPTRPQPTKSEPSTSTAIQTVKKGTQRVAHMPNEKFIDRPGVLEPLASKIPANIRSTYLNMMIDECFKIYLTATDAYARAQHEELATSKKCTAIQIYKNSAVLTVSRLRKEVQECNGIKKSGSDCSMLQKLPSAISGTSNNANAGSWSIENKCKRNGPNINELKGAKFYENISKWILSEEELQENGFPRPHPSGDKGRAMIYSQNKQNPPKGLFRPCCRCGKEYTVDKKGFPTIKEECIYHPNRKYRFRGEVKYQCCGQDGMSDGCCVAPSHVYEYVDYENLKGYVRTMTPERVTDDYGVYSLDCEMCYTTQGLDLTRITVIDSTCKVVYETLIKPLHPIIDYNTRYSGITEEHMANVRTTLLEVQATLLSMFNSKTILIGHSLESDFKALKIIHDTVIDTSVLFPHKMGPPYKRALRNLSSEYLKKIIQNSVEGHDSAEDATVCMELLHYKLKEDLKTR